ncbi:xanthine dehydrogenase accessory protein XdhC [Labrys monachus]|uniref:Xanthine dehydrogenase accessory factor n=1 Tax=Labrys monachus TaxID=217067 RepID=A0ABU0FGK8_9HYPH|nr:xanthine dehydrogenase accessory protein XdhC [Labrys monachus]MDQ0393195.1 xanthine dehydrogenase accessory factor [Labrys monachus]
MGIFATLERMVERDGGAVLVTVMAVSGSSPREAGTRMAVRPDGAFSGTIGGGALEWQALAEAQALLASAAGSRMRMTDRALGPDLGQCCGGRVRLMLERFDRTDLPWLAALSAREDGAEMITIGLPQPGGSFSRRPAGETEAALAPSAAPVLLADGRLVERFGSRNPPVYLFGAGHVGRALVMALAPLPFELFWFDPRTDAFPAHVPRQVRIMRDPQPERSLGQAPDDARILIMTHSHALDLAIALAALAAGRFAYVGVIGSQTKRARFLSQMRQAGLDEERIARLTCPIGIPGIEGKEPAVIAASVVAQILLLPAYAAAGAGREESRLPAERRSVGGKAVS